MRSDPLCVGLDDALRTIGLVAFAGGISRVPSVRDRLCIKGGTLLRLLTKGAIGRPPSKDLDGTLMDAEGFDGHLIETAVLDATNQLLQETFRERCNVLAKCIQRPGGATRGVSAYVYQMSVVATGLKDNPTKVTRADGNAFKFDLCDDELVLRDLVTPLQGTYFRLPLDLLAYAPLQSVAEKLRAILQKHQYYDQAVAAGRDLVAAAGSFAPRHVMDLEYLCQLLQPGDLDRLPAVFHQKCEARQVPQAERTRDRLLTPLLRSAVEAECARTNRQFERCWGLLVRLTDRVISPPH